MVRVEHAARLAEVGVLVRVLAPWEVEHGVEPVAHPRLLRVLRTHSLEAVELLVDGDAHRVGQLLFGSPGPVLRDGVLLGVAELLADGVHLAAQEQLALLLVEVVADLGADLLLQLEVGQHLPRPGQRELQAQLDVDRLEELDPLLDREIGRVRGGVRELTGVVDPCQHVGDPARAAVLENGLDDGPVLARELLGPGRGRLLLDFLGLDVQRAVRTGLAGADVGAARATDDERERAVGELSGALDGCHGADAREAAVDSGNEHNAVAGLLGRGTRPLRFVGLERDGHDHLREHDPLCERQQGQKLRLSLWHSAGITAGGHSRFPG